MLKHFVAESRESANVKLTSRLLPVCVSGTDCRRQSDLIRLSGSHDVGHADLLRRAGIAAIMTVITSPERVPSQRVEDNDRTTLGSCLALRVDPL